MNAHVLNADYALDEVTNVWYRPGYGGIAYSDAEGVEERIAGIVGQANDLSVLSGELRQYCTDWPSLYHLGSARANILRPFESDLRGDILEIGAGCGAITRYLGESGGNVLALEGSLRRAAIARSRTRDLPNVTVVSDRFDRFTTARLFDVVTLIGVLEYAAMFSADEAPAPSMLERARSLLKPGGKLIIAIENQLGLKYFAGAPEDHVGQPMYGIEGRYRDDQPQTYGRKALSVMLKRAGFARSEFFAPFPDYKLPASVVSESGFLCEKFDAAALAWQSVRRDPQLPNVLGFSPELVWSTLFQNGVALELANSFLIVAETSELGSKSASLAWHFTSERAKEFCKQTRFVKLAHDSVEVHCDLLSPNSKASGASGILKFNVAKRVEYSLGRPLSQELIEIVAQDGWQMREVGEFLERYFDILKSIVPNTPPAKAITAGTLLPGECFDVLPQNIIVGRPGHFHAIDREWILNNEIPAGWLVFRVLRSLLDSLTRLGAGSTEMLKTPMDFLRAAFESIGFAVTDAEIERYARLEMEVQAEVAGVPATAEETIKWLRSAPLAYLNLSKAYNELNRAVRERDEQLGQLRRELGAVYGSLSMRATAPLRKLVRVLRRSLDGG